MDKNRPATRVIRDVATAVLGATLDVESVAEGVSTYVYRFGRRRGFLSRVLPEEGATSAPELAAHTNLRQKGVQVPEVLYWEDRKPEVGRSVMMTTEIRDSHWKSEVGNELPYILRAAGRDVALLNQVPVDGSGWIRRDRPKDRTLRGEMRRNARYARWLRTIAQYAPGPYRKLDADEKTAAIVRGEAPRLDARHADLAHGDLDLTHIYAQAGRYTGIIDLGGHGTGPYYDLGHFRS